MKSFYLLLRQYYDKKRYFLGIDHTNRSEEISKVSDCKSGAHRKSHKHKKHENKPPVPKQKSSRISHDKTFQGFRATEPAQGHETDRGNNQSPNPLFSTLKSETMQI